MHPEHISIGELAYRLWQSRGCPEGSAEQDWLDAEKQLKAAQSAMEPRKVEPHTIEPRTIESRAVEARAADSTPSNAIDNALKETFPASDPPASSLRPDEPPANADAKWKAAASRKGAPGARPRPSKTAQSKPGAKPPG